MMYSTHIQKGEKKTTYTKKEPMIKQWSKMLITDELE